MTKLVDLEKLILLVSRYDDEPTNDGDALADLRDCLQYAAEQLDRSSPLKRQKIALEIASCRDSHPGVALLLSTFLFDRTKDVTFFQDALSLASHQSDDTAKQFDLFINLVYLLSMNKAAFESDEYFKLRHVDLYRWYQNILGKAPHWQGDMSSVVRNRAVIFTNHMNNPRVFAPAWDALELAHELKEKFGVEVLLINCNFWLRGQLTPIWPLKSHVSWNGPLAGYWPHRRKTIPFHVLKDPFATANNFRELEAVLQNFMPTFAIALGDCNIYADFFAAIRPVVTVHFTVDYPITTLSRPSYHPNLDETRPEFLAALPHRKKDITLLPHYSLLGRTDVYPRDQLGYLSNDKVLVIIGHRLHTEVTDQLLTVLTNILSRVPKAQVLFAGHFDRFRQRMELWAEVATRAKFIGHVADVTGICNAADLFINPDRTGGGMSAVVALAAGVPVLSLARGDVGFVVGEKAYATWDDLQVSAVRMAVDNDFYEAASIAALERSRVLLNRSNVVASILRQLAD